MDGLRVMEMNRQLNEIRRSNGKNVSRMYKQKHKLNYQIPK